jgi:holo-[acyl-carrier protein] synthase
MPVTGIGIDVMELGRFERALERTPRLRDRLFSAQEISYADARARPARHLAARFCAKEAVAKSLGLSGWSFADVEVIASAPPTVRLRGRTERRARELGAEVQISLTHDRGIAAAVAFEERQSASGEPVR